jgi:hypothetical protein
MGRSLRLLVRGRAGRLGGRLLPGRRGGLGDAVDVEIAARLLALAGGEAGIALAR